MAALPSAPALTKSWGVVKELTNVSPPAEVLEEMMELNVCGPTSIRWAVLVELNTIDA